jgi:hypothetical protein
LSITYKNIADKRIKELFAQTKSSFEALEEVKLVLRGTQIKGSTMQAQPIIRPSSFIRGRMDYRIRLAEYVRDSDELRVDQLSDEVLVGWFAHELGHVVDYLNRSGIQMLLFGIQYLSSAHFRRQAEHRADQIAAKHGFHREVLETKKFLFHHDMIDPLYRKKMQKYYMSIDDLNAWVEENVAVDPII